MNTEGNIQTEEPNDSTACNGKGNIAHTTGATDSCVGLTFKAVFAFLHLPAELRERIYYFAVQPIAPIDTATIPGTPDSIVIPKVARLCQQMRSEALHVLHQKRPVEISLHSSENVRRALLWADTMGDQRKAFGEFIFSGRLPELEFSFFHVRLEFLDESPFFRAHVKPAASPEGDVVVARIRDGLLMWLSRKVKKAKEGKEGLFVGSELTELIELVARESQHGPYCTQTS